MEFMVFCQIRSFYILFLFLYRIVMSAIMNPGPGDGPPYIQHAAIDNFPIANGVPIVKGEIYTMNANGFLVQLAATGGAITNLNGAFQALASSPAPSSGDSDGARRVQCAVKRSRIYMKLPADATPGDDVTVAAASTTVTADTVEVSSSQKIGTIFEIVSGNAKATANEIGVIDLLE